MENIHVAAFNGNVNRVRMFLNSGTNVNARHQNQTTPLIWAAMMGRLAVVRELLDRGANVNARGNGQTALQWAASFGHLPVVRLLLDRGANTNRVLNRRNIRANIRNVIRKHNAAKTILKYHRAATLRRRLSFIGSNTAKSLPRNMTRKILTARK